MVSLLEIFIGLFLLRFVWLRLCLGSHSALELKCTIGPVGLSLFFLWFLWPLSGPSQPLIPHFPSFFMSPHLFLCSFAMSLNLLKLSLLPACDHIITPILKKYFCVYLMCVCSYMWGWACTHHDAVWRSEDSHRRVGFCLPFAYTQSLMVHSCVFWASGLGLFSYLCHLAHHRNTGITNMYHSFQLYLVSRDTSSGPHVISPTPFCFSIYEALPILQISSLVFLIYSLITPLSFV